MAARDRTRLTGRRHFFSLAIFVEICVYFGEKVAKCSQCAIWRQVSPASAKFGFAQMRLRSSFPRQFRRASLRVFSLFSSYSAMADKPLIYVKPLAENCLVFRQKPRAKSL